MSSKGPRCLQTVTSRRQRALAPLITPPNHHRRTNGSPDLHTRYWRPISVEAPTNCGLPYISTCCIIFLTLNVCAVANGLSGFVASVSAGAFYLDYTDYNYSLACNLPWRMLRPCCCVSSCQVLALWRLSGAVAQVVERSLSMWEVRGSIPRSSKLFCFRLMKSFPKRD